MARLDATITHMLSHGGLELLFETGAGIVMRSPAGVTQLVKQSLTQQQLVGGFLELAPPEIRAGFPVEGTTRFTYSTDKGLVSVLFEKRGNMVRANVVPISADAAHAAEVVAAPEIVADARKSWAWGPAKQEPPKPEPRRIVEKRSFARSDPRAAIDELLAFMQEKRASDLHLSATCAPMLRVDGGMKEFADLGTLSPDFLEQMLFSIAPERCREEFVSTRDTDFAYETEQARYRVNLFADRNGTGSVIRQIPHRIPSAEELGLSPALLELCSLRKGLVLVTGPTGSGKSTTLAAMLDHVNRTREDHVITIEDPIEFVHPNKSCLVNQREVGVHTAGFKQALRAALREDPDVVLVGELRDLETVAIAIETAETGHLVFGTLHTNTAPGTVDRIIDQFPTDRQPQVRLMLSESLKGVVSQTLCRKIGGGRIAAHEVLICNGATSNLIREGKTFQLPSVMQTGRAHGNVMLNDALLDLVKRRVVEPLEALSKAVAKAELKVALERAGFSLTPPTNRA